MHRLNSDNLVHIAYHAVTLPQSHTCTMLWHASFYSVLSSSSTASNCIACTKVCIHLSILRVPNPSVLDFHNKQVAHALNCSQARTNTRPVTQVPVHAVQRIKQTEQLQHILLQGRQFIFKYPLVTRRNSTEIQATDKTMSLRRLADSRWQSGMIYALQIYNYSKAQTACFTQRKIDLQACKTYIKTLN